MTNYAPPGYPPVYPPQPQYAPPPLYGPPPGYPPAPAYGPIVELAYGYPQSPPPANGTLDQFYGQRSGGSGPALKFPAIGTLHVVTIARPIGNGDVVQATDMQRKPVNRRDGSPVWEMRVPVLIQPSHDNPEGRATWYVKGAARDELTRAMAEAHAPEGTPESGATVAVAFVGTRNAGGSIPAKEYAMVYASPGQPLPRMPQMPAAPVQQAPAYQPPAPQYVQPAPPAPQYAPPAAPAYVPPPVPQFAPPAAPQAAPPAAAAPQYAPAAGVPQMTPEQQAFYAQFTPQTPPA